MKIISNISITMAFTICNVVFTIEIIAEFCSKVHICDRYLSVSLRKKKQCNFSHSKSPLFHSPKCKGIWEERRFVFLVNAAAGFGWGPIFGLTINSNL
jgi:hypothetical protein